MFAYPDAARYRLGTNYQMLPTNAAMSHVYTPFQRDGFMNFGTNYGDDLNYVGSQLRPVQFKTSGSGERVQTTLTEHEKWVGKVSSYTSEVKPEDFEQATMLWDIIGKEPGHQERFIGNVADDVSKVIHVKLRDMVYGMFVSTPRRRRC